MMHFLNQRNAMIESNPLGKLSILFWTLKT
jgi:hypothetical protein